MTHAITVIDEQAIRRIVGEVVRAEVQAAIETLQTPAKPAEPDRLLDREGVAAYLSVHPRDVRRLVLDGYIPEPIALGARRQRWRLSAIEAGVRKLESSSAETLKRSRGAGSVVSMNTEAAG